MASLEDILKKVVLADPGLISEGTDELRVAFKSQAIIPQLCNVLGTSEQMQIRQYAAVLLRKHLSKKKIWLQLPTDIKKGLKDGLIQALINEPENSVRNSIAQLIGTIVKHVKNVNQQWPELLEFLQKTYHSNNPAEQELGALAIAGIADISIDTMSTYLPAMCILFKHVLDSSSDLTHPTVYHTIMAMKLFIPALEKHKNCVTHYGNMIPRVLAAAHAQAVKDESKACQELELLEDLLEDAVGAITPHLSTVLSTCLQMGLDQSLGNDVRCKAILVTGWIVKKKKKVVLKLNLVQPLVEALFTLMSIPTDDPEDDDYVSATESDKPGTIASQTLDILALCLPPDKLIPILAGHIEPAMQGEDIYRKKAGYIALSVIVEGCQAYIRNNCLEPFVKCIGQGISHPSPVVRNAALFALGQFSDYLQPEITKYAPELLPVLFVYLDQLCQTLCSNEKEPAGVDRMFYALEAFIENLDRDLLPYLPSLMERLFVTMDPTRSSPRLRQLALSSLGSAAHAVGEGIMPYFSTFIELSKNYMTQHFTDEANLKLQVQAIDSLGMMARAVGPTHFMPLAPECLYLGLNLLKGNEEEVDLRKSVYGLLGALSTVLKENMGPQLMEIMPRIFASIKSNEGIETHFKDEEKAFPVYEEVREQLEDDDINEEFSDDDDDDVNSDLEGYTLKNSYIEEKEEALIALKELALETKGVFGPYMKESFDVVYQALSYPHDDVKSAAINCITQLCINWHTLDTKESTNELCEALLVVIPKLSELIHCDPEHSVVMAALELFADLLKELKDIMFKGQGHKEAIINCIKDVLKGNTEAQRQDGGEEGAGGEDEEDPEDEAEQDEMLFEYAAEVVVPLGHAMHKDDFFRIFKEIVPIVISRTKKNCSVAQRSFCTGMLAECMSALGVTQIPKLLRETPVLPVLLKLATDKEQDVCNNAIYGLGEMAKHGVDCMYQHYPAILTCLSETLKTHNGPQLLDNVCGCIARLIVTNVQAVPLGQVLPVLIKHLPLREDHEEIQPVFECISFLYSAGYPELVAQLEQVVVAAADVIGTDKTNESTMVLVKDLMISVQRDFPDKFNNAVNTLTPEAAQRLTQAFVVP